MKIVTLLENKAKRPGLIGKHGLSLYIETGENKILFDVGPDKSFIKNAEKLGIDLKAVDICIISHGHCDHGGGLEAFLKLNEKAKIYISEYAFNKFYYKLAYFLKMNVSLNSKFKNNSRVHYVNHGDRITSDIHILSNISGSALYPSGNQKLLTKKNGTYIQDDFCHELNVLILENGKSFLLLGCSHKGILNIARSGLDYALEYFQVQQLEKIIGGFHLYDMKVYQPKNQIYLNQLINELRDLEVNEYITCHCTGDDVFNFLKAKLNHRIYEINTGDIITE